MLNPQLTNVVIASLKAAGITPPELSPVRPFPKPRATTEELINALANSKLEDPYQDPAVIAIASKHYVQSLGTLDQGHRQMELERRAAELDSHKDLIIEQLQEEFNKAAQELIQQAEPIKGVTDPATISPRSASHDFAVAATNVVHGIMKLESIIKAWSDLWAALGVGQPRDMARPFIFMNPNARTWTELRLNPTIWEAIRHGEPLTLAGTPQHVNERYSAMWDNEQAALDEVQESFHRKNGAAMLKAFRS